MFFLFHSGASPLPHSHSRGVRVEEPDSDSEDFSPTPSLAEISSDDLSWLEDKEPGKDECERHQSTAAQCTMSGIEVQHAE